MTTAYGLASDIEYQKELIATELKDIQQQKIHIHQKLIEQQQEKLLEILHNHLRHLQAGSSLVELSAEDVPDETDVSKRTDDSLNALMTKLHVQENANAADVQVAESMKKDEEQSKNAASSEKLSMALGALDNNKEGSPSSDGALEKTLSQLEGESKDSKSLDEELATLEKLKQDTAFPPDISIKDDKEVAPKKDPNDEFSGAQSLVAISDDSRGSGVGKQRAGESWDKWYDGMHQRLNALNVDQAIEQLGAAAKSVSAQTAPSL